MFGSKIGAGTTLSKPPTKTTTSATAGKPMTGFSKGLGAAGKPFIEKYQVLEDTKLGDKTSLDDTTLDGKPGHSEDYINEYFKGTLFYQKTFKNKITTLEKVESFDKQMNEIEIDVKRSIDHTLNILAGEIAHGNSVIKDARDQLENLKELKKSHKKHSFPSPFFQQFMDDLNKKAQDVKDSIKSFERSLEPSTEKQTSDSLLNLIRTQHNAIIRCSANLSNIQKSIEPLKEKIITIMKDDGKNTDFVSSIGISDETTEINTLNVIDQYNKFLEGRKRDLEKRTAMKEEVLKEKCAVAATKTAFGGSRFGGLNKTSGTSNLASKANATTNTTK